jgi:hypothetical protein
MILDLAIEQTATEAGKNIAAVAIAFVVVAAKGPADERGSALCPYGGPKGRVARGGCR